MSQDAAYFAQIQFLGVPFAWLGFALQSTCDSLQQTKPGMYATLAASLMQLVITVLLLHPGYVRTDMTGGAGTALATRE